MHIWQKYFIRKNHTDHSDGRASKSPALLISAAGLVLLLAFLLNLLFGSTGSRLWEALESLFSGDTQSAAWRIIVYVRLPRACACALSGSALAVSGVLIQAVLNNALAAPNIIGVNAGAGFAALLLIGLFPGLMGWLPAAAVAGALLASLAIYLLAARTGASRMTITLAGIALSSILTAGMNTVKTVLPDTVYNASTFLIGGFSGISYAQLNPSRILILLGLLAACALAGDVDVLVLGGEIARGLGLPVKELRFLLLMTASLLAGAAVSFSGLLGFVGLIVPHIFRSLLGSRHRLLIPASALGGASFVLLCDLAGRLIVAPYELPVGILLSLIGGPFFLFLLLHRRRAKLYD